MEILSKTTDFIYLHYVAEFVSNVTIIIIVGYVILEMMKRKKVNMYTLIEAINGYLLLGIMFMSLVSFCDQYIIGSYKGVTEASMDIPYYTIITLTTAGYGDITPTLPIAKSLSMFIAVTGQFYVAVIVAIIVGKYSNNAQE
ncbi:MAG: two pore domain potassium channel family protein [Flavobacteriaceae bacterium]|nr:two pore domain potassium channel family protein [Flavobacteriaceae bacterium]